MVRDKNFFDVIYNISSASVPAPEERSAVYNCAQFVVSERFKRPYALITL